MWACFHYQSLHSSSESVAMTFENILLLPSVAWLIYNTDSARKLSILPDDVKTLEFLLCIFLLSLFKCPNMTDRYASFANLSFFLQRSKIWTLGL